MGTKTLTRTFKLLITAAMVQSPFIPDASAAAGKGATCNSRKACEDAYKGAAAKGGIISAQAGQASGDSTNVNAGNLFGAASGTATVACEAKTACETQKSQCKPDKKTGCTQDDCDAIGEILNTAASECAQAAGVAGDAAKTQSATGAGGGGGNMMTGMMMGAAMGALAAMMMQKKDDKPQPPPVNPLAALQPNGQIDCSKQDAYNYQACNGYMETKCNTQLDEATCVAFEGRYCSGSGTTAPPPVAAAAPPAIDPATGIIMSAPVMGAAGEGVGTSFCQNVMAYNYCKTSGREQCPSCLQLAKNASPACTQNPGLCLAQNSLPEIEKAKQSCPTDPAFSNPAYTAGGGAQVPPNIAAGAPAVVLPQSVGSSAAAGRGNSAGTSTVSTGGGQEALIGSTVGSRANSAQREGQANANINGNSGAGVSTGYTPSSVGGNSSGGREFASAGNSYRPSSVGGPSDIESKFGPSLFTTSSQVIRNRCQTGRLNNCR